VASSLESASNGFVVFKTSLVLLYPSLRTETDPKPYVLLWNLVK
jgi:hypothetical protein